jgi:kynureninase
MLGLVEEVFRVTAGCLHIILLVLRFQNIVHRLAEQFLLGLLTYFVFDHGAVVVDDLVHSDEEVLRLLHRRLELPDFGVFSCLKYRHLLR